MELGSTGKGAHVIVFEERDMIAMLHFKDRNLLACSWSVGGELRGWKLRQAVMPRNWLDVKGFEPISKHELETKAQGLLRSVAFR